MRKGREQNEALAPPDAGAIPTWLKGWDYWRAEADEFHEVGDHVVVLTTYHGRGRESGVEIESLGAHVFKLREGKVVRLEIFASREKAIASVPAPR